jgi:putative salt-induced outer membrane protein
MNKISYLSALACALSSAVATVAMADPPKDDGLWRGALAASLAVAAGNTQSTNFSIGADGVRLTKEDKITLAVTSLYGSREVAGKSEKTANLARAAGRYDWNVSDRSFVFGTGEYEQDKIQRLDSRFVVGAGFGYKLIKEKDLSWDLFGGVVHASSKNSVTLVSGTPPRSFDSTVTSSGSELLLGEESNHKLTDTTSFKQKLTMFPNLSRSGEYRAQFDASIVTAIANGINLQVTLSNRYNSEAAIGTKKSDTLLLTGINIALGAK